MVDQLIVTSTLLLGAYSFYNYEMNNIEVAEYTIQNRKIPKEFNNYKIVQISDLHNKSFGKNNYKLLKEVEKLNPDAICITGDLIDGENKKYQVALNLIDRLTEKYNVYHVIGNHEQKSLTKKHKHLYEEYSRNLYEKNIISLDNKVVQIKKGKSHINLYGIVIPLEYYPYFFSKHKNKKSTLENKFIKDKLGKIKDDEYSILLAHNPFFFEDYSSWGADLVLSGHVHGGIIRIPYIGGLLSPNREFFPKYDYGKYEKKSSTMLLSKGLGGAKIFLRVNCKPEIVQITLKSL